MRFTLALFAACSLCSASLAPPAAQVAAPPAAQSAPGSSLFIDAAIVDNDGRTVMGLRPNELRVAVNGEQRRVVSLRYIYRGTGAATAASLATVTGGTPAAAEPERLILVVMDETGIQPGQEKRLIASAKRVLDEFSAADRVAVVTLPLRNAKISFESDNAVRTAALSRITGRAASTGTGMDDSLRAVVDAAQVSAASANADAGAEEGRAPNPNLGRAADAASEDAHDSRLKANGPVVQELQPIVDAVRGMPGLKTLLVVRQSDAAENIPPLPGPERARAIASFVESATRARTTVSLLLLGTANGRRGANEDDLRSIATATGGTVISIKTATDTKGLERLSAVIGGSYLIEVEGRATDTPDRTHAVVVQTTRAKTVVRVSTRWAVRTDRVPSVVSTSPQPQDSPATTSAALGAMPAPTAAARAAAPAAPVTTIRRSSRPDPELTLLVAKVREYLAAYVREFSNVVAEEDYWQDQPRGWRGGPKNRQLRSDLLIVKTDSDVGWIQYRDVFEVDGKPVRDRESRVQKLFLENPLTAPDRATEISDESSRYNVGTLGRTINLPVLALALLGPSRIAGLAFERKGEEVVEGVRTVRLNYEERGRPTLILQTTTRDDAPSSGTLWVEPATGRIIKTLLKVKALQTEASMTVTYRPGGNTGIWVPALMEEDYVVDNYQITGKATYKNFRSFNVSTNLEMKK